MKVVASIISACNFSCLIVLLVISAFHDSLVLPDITILAGRFHVLLLHLSIGGLFMLAILRLLKNAVRKDDYERIFSLLVSVVVFVSLLSAITGLFISSSGDYSEDAVASHRKAGISFSVLLYAYSVLRNALGKIPEILLLVITIVALIITGHQGGMITHGSEFLKVKSDQATVMETTEWQKKPLFESVIMPFIQKKCISCHNEQKSKGELILTNARFWQRGGKSGPILIAGNPDQSLILKRIALPIEDEHHMPPEGKPQLKSEEIELIRYWIQSGADYQQAIEKYQDNDSLMAIALKMIPKEADIEKQYAFSHASSEVVKRLNNPYIRVAPLYAGSPALSASFFVASAYRTTSLESLKSVQEQLVQLNLSGMPLNRKDLEVVAGFKNLEQLQLNNTTVSDQDILLLQELKNLKQLSVVNCKLSPVVPFLSALITP